jgi:transcriptional regulator with XRE-family HTH domain
MHREWLKKGLKQHGKSASGLARSLGIDPSIVSKMVTGKRRISAEELPRIARYLGVPEPRSVDIVNGLGRPAEIRLQTQVVSVTKVASGGVWREVGALSVFDRAIIPAVPNPRIEGLTQYAIRVEGTDTDKLFRLGDYAIFVPFDDIRTAPRDGDLVEVEQRRGNMKQTTIRRVRLNGEAVELWPESTAPEWQAPMPYPSQTRFETTQIVGLYVGMFRPGDI